MRRVSGAIGAPLASGLRRGLAASATATRSPWEALPMGPPDPILGLSEAYQKDASAVKINLGVGAYRGDDAKPYILPSVREAERRVLEKQYDHEYAGIVGIKEFNDLAVRFAYGEDSAVYDRLAAVQSLSGTGACRVVGQLLTRFGWNAIYMPGPTWGNHIPIMKDAGLETKSYRYYDPETCGLDFAGLCEDVEGAPDGSAFMLHACAHNPTGVDPTQDQWAELSELMKRKGHAIFFDSAYQGFASGDSERDAWAVRKFVADGHNILLAQSFAKNFGLYGERIGCLSAVCSDEDEAARVLSQLKILIRPMYSNPPVNGARLVVEVLKDPALRQQWTQECKGMADRIMDMRMLLRKKLEDMGNPRSWQHVTDQIGMFCFSGLSEAEVLKLREEHHIYLTKNGRISMAGVTSGNIDHLATSIHKVTT